MIYPISSVFTIYNICYFLLGIYAIFIGTFLIFIYYFNENSPLLNVFKKIILSMMLTKEQDKIRMLIIPIFISYLLGILSILSSFMESYESQSCPIEIPEISNNIMTSIIVSSFGILISTFLIYAGILIRKDKRKLSNIFIMSAILIITLSTSFFILYNII